MAGNGEQVRKTFSISLDISRSISNREFTVVEGDTGNVLIITLTDDGEAVDLTDCRVMAVFSKSDGTTVSQDSGTEGNGVTVGGEKGNVVEIDLFPASFAPGMVECELQVYSGEELLTLVTTAKFNFRCRRSILNSDTVQAVEEYPILTSLLSDTKKLQLQAKEVLDRADAFAAAEEERRTSENLRAQEERARDLGEEERIRAELLREEAEALRESLYDRMAELAADMPELRADLEAMLDKLPDIVHVSGIVKGDGNGGFTAAAEGVDYPSFQQISTKYDKPLRVLDISVPVSLWAGSTALSDFPYEAVIGIEGATAAMVPEVVFDAADAISGNFAPIAQSTAGGVLIYAKEVPEADLVLPVVTLWRAV